MADAPGGAQVGTWKRAPGHPVSRAGARGYLVRDRKLGAVAQLGEHLLCKQGVAGSIPVRSTP